MYLRRVDSLDAPPPERSSLHVPVRARLCVYSACLRRDVATQVGMQFRNARVAHEASSPSPSEGLLLLEEETEAEGKLAATRKELVGIPLTRLLYFRLRLCTSSLSTSPPSLCSFLGRKIRDT